MSKLYDEYLRKKKGDSNKYYLFKSGMFYIFLDIDAKKISEITSLKLTNLNKDIVKCGFPENSLNKYMNIFKYLGLNIEIVRLDNNICINDLIIKKIKNIDIDNLTPVKALNILYEIKELVVNE